MALLPPAPSNVLVNAQTFIRSFSEQGGKVYLLHGDDLVFGLAMGMSAQALANGASVAVVDGCNRFDALAIARYARKRRIDPSILLNRIFISRGFTCYQMEAAICNRLPVFLKQLMSRMAQSDGAGPVMQGTHPMSRGVLRSHTERDGVRSVHGMAPETLTGFHRTSVATGAKQSAPNQALTAIILGLLDTFYDDQAPLRDVQKILSRVLMSSQLMKNDGVSILIVCAEYRVLPANRNQLWTELKSGVDCVYKLTVTHDNKPHFLLERH